MKAIFSSSNAPRNRGGRSFSWVRADGDDELHERGEYVLFRPGLGLGPKEIFTVEELWQPFVLAECHGKVDVADYGCGIVFLKELVAYAVLHFLFSCPAVVCHICLLYSFLLIMLILISTPSSYRVRGRPKCRICRCLHAG